MPSSSPAPTAPSSLQVLLEIETSQAQAPCAHLQPTAAALTPALARALETTPAARRYPKAHERQAQNSTRPPRTGAPQHCATVPALEQAVETTAASRLVDATLDTLADATLDTLADATTDTLTDATRGPLPDATRGPLPDDTTARIADATRGSRAAVSGGEVSSGSHVDEPTERRPGSRTEIALLRGPRLITSHNPCAGYFPDTSTVTQGQVQLNIEVDAEGHAHASETLLELPRSSGFAGAAIACAAHLHFAPALDLHGRPVSAHTRIALRFERS